MAKEAKEKRQKRTRKPRANKVEQPAVEPVEETATEPTGVPQPRVKRSFATRTFMLIVSGLVAVAGLGMFIVYFITQNMGVGAPSIFMLGGGVFLFRHYWRKTEDSVTEHIGEINKQQVNSMNIYPDKIVFEDVAKPEGYPWQCRNDSKRYYVHIWDMALSRLVPFVLPDQQYYDPEVFAGRVLMLPAHRKIFKRKEKLMQKIQTALLVIGIGIVWLLIVTTGGG